MSQKDSSNLFSATDLLLLTRRTSQIPIGVNANPLVLGISENQQTRVQDEDDDFPLEELLLFGARRAVGLDYKGKAPDIEMPAVFQTIVQAVDCEEREKIGDRTGDDEVDGQDIVTFVTWLYERGPTQDDINGLRTIADRHGYTNLVIELAVCFLHHHLSARLHRAHMLAPELVTAGFRDLAALEAYNEWNSGGSPI